MTKKFTIAKSAVLVGSALLAANVNAAGFQIVEHSASGLGRAFSGEAAIADNAATLARNPASLSMLETANFTSGISYIDPDVQVDFWKSGSKYKSDVVSESEAAPYALVPNSFYSRPITDSLTWGMGAYADFGLASDYSDATNKEFGDIAGDTAVTVINLNNSLAYEVNDKLALGVSASILLAHAELNRYSSMASIAPGYDGDVVASMKGDGIGFGYKVGALYKFNDDTRVGIAYTGASDIDMKGEFTGLQANTDNGLFDYVVGIDGELTLSLPSIMEVSAFHQVTDSVAVHASWVHIGWSAFEEILATSPNGECSSKGENDKVCMQKPEEWKDSNRYSIGATYTYSPALTLRMGLAKDETPTDEHVTASIPDSDRNWYTAGATYKQDQHSFDFGFAYIVGDSTGAHLEEGSYFEVTKSTALIYAIQYAYSFK